MPSVSVPITTVVSGLLLGPKDSVSPVKGSKPDSNVMVLTAPTLSDSILAVYVKASPSGSAKAEATLKL